MQRTKSTALLIGIAILGVIAISFAIGHPIVSPDLGAGLLIANAIAGVPEGAVTEIKKLVEDQGRAFEELKRTNEEILKAKADGKSVSDLEAKSAKIEADISRIEGDYKKAYAELEKKFNRPNLAAVGGDADKELKSFNRALKAHYKGLGRPLPAEVGADQYQQYKSALDGWMRRGDQIITADEQKALSIGSDPDGGYLVTPEIEETLDRVATNMSAMRRVATVRPIGSNSYKKGVVTSGASGGWAGEASGAAETGTPKIAQLEFVVGKMFAEPRATSDLLEDASINLEAWLADEVSLTFDELEGAAFIAGNGVNKPRGILAYNAVANANYAWGSLGYIKTGAAADFAALMPADGLIDMQTALKRQYRGSAAWLMNGNTLGKVRKFKDKNDQYIWVPGLQNGQVGQLLGSPVEVDDYMPDVGAGEFPVAYADFRRGYVIVDRRGVVVLRDPYTEKPYIKFYTTKRVGGGVQNFEAIKLLKCEA